MKKIILILLVGFVGMNMPAMAVDGVKIISKTKDISSGSVSNTTIYMTENSMAVENNGGRDNSSFIFNSEKEEFTYVDHSKKEYYHFDKAAMQQLKQQIQMMMMMMKQFAASMSEEQKKKMGKFMNKDASPMEFNAVGSSTKVGKWNAQKYEGISEGEKATEMYIASFKTIGIPQDKFQVMDKMMDYFKTNLSEIATFLPTGGSFSQMGFDDSSPVFKEGIPVKTVSYKSETADNENTVESINQESFSDALFKAPSGYSKKQINMQMK
ncbi:hypothetical protein [Reichenbachiella sp. MALMAid0571]|uniref:hypothetical protein n=1 Tax=Reichenbachiella sp. MALMAid0571 TaxID=3143939 RepID=UPI0032DEBCAA